MGFVVGHIWRWQPMVRALHCASPLRASTIPFYDMKKLKTLYSRAGGPGGQNVNKVDTKVEIRVHVEDIEISEKVRARLIALSGNRINRHNEIVVVNSETRTQKQNLENAVGIVRELVFEAMVEPKEWNRNSKTKAKFHKKRLEEKKRHSMKKANRRIDG